MQCCWQKVRCAVSTGEKDKTSIMKIKFHWNAVHLWLATFLLVCVQSFDSLYGGVSTANTVPNNCFTLNSGWKENILLRSDKWCKRKHWLNLILSKVCFVQCHNSHMVLYHFILYMHTIIYRDGIKSSSMLISGYMYFLIKSPTTENRKITWRRESCIGWKYLQSWKTVETMKTNFSRKLDFLQSIYDDYL